jgi:hypothetical protein
MAVGLGVMDRATTPRAGRFVLLDERDTCDVGVQWEHMARRAVSDLKRLVLRGNYDVTISTSRPGGVLRTQCANSGDRLNLGFRPRSQAR